MFDWVLNTPVHVANLAQKQNSFDFTKNNHETLSFLQCINFLSLSYFSFQRLEMVCQSSTNTNFTIGSFT